MTDVVVTSINTTSSGIGQLVAALSLAQLGFKPALKDTKNPFYNSKYADLATIIEATQDSLSKNGLTVIQLPIVEARAAGVKSILAHSSGEYVENTLLLPAESQGKDGKVKFDAQSVGSAITYARRYSYQALVGIAAEVDDDGNAASGVYPTKPKNQIYTTPPPFAPGPPRAEFPDGFPVHEVPATETPLDKESAKPFTKAIKDIGKSIGENGLEQIREYIKRTTGKTESKLLTKSEWESILAGLENAQRSDTLTNLLSGE